MEPTYSAPRAIFHVFDEGLDEQERIDRFFDPLEPVDIYRINLPHWRQQGVMYFVTFRLVDALPAKKLEEWVEEREQWRRLHPGPMSGALSAEYRRRFTVRIEQWLDQGGGSRVLEIPDCRRIVEACLRHFDGERYVLGEFVVASTHVHVIVTPKAGYTLERIVHTWKSYTAHEILKLPEAVRRMKESMLAMDRHDRHVWQKESYDHIVRSAGALHQIEEYIRRHTGR